MSEEVKNENVETTTTQIIEDNKEAEVKEPEQKEEVAAKQEEVAENKEESKEESKEQRGTRGSDSHQQRRGPGGGRPGKDFQGQQRFPKFKRKICKFCYEKELKIDYKNSTVLEHFITDRGKILPRRVTGTCSKHQRLVAKEIKKARIIALLPFIEQ